MYKKFIDHFGLKGIFKRKEQPNNVVFLSEAEEQAKREQFELLKNAYVGSDDLSEEHINFLIRIIEDENNRQSVIESKLGQNNWSIRFNFYSNCFVCTIFLRSIKWSTFYY